MRVSMRGLALVACAGFLLFAASPLAGQWPSQVPEEFREGIQQQKVLAAEARACEVVQRLGDKDLTFQVGFNGVPEGLTNGTEYKHGTVLTAVEFNGVTIADVMVEQDSAESFTKGVAKDKSVRFCRQVIEPI